MRHWIAKRYWLIGASDGLGAALAERMSRAGVELVLSARSADRLEALAARLPGRASVQVIDVADADSVAQAAAAVGPVDGVVFLAGVYWPFGARDWNAEQAVQMADVNFTGLVRVMGAVVPQMVARDRGHIVITSSLTAFRGLPGSIGYTASKAGSLSLAECMRADLRKTGVEVQVVLPGFIKTRLTDRNDFHMPQLMSPETAARYMFDHMGSDRFKCSFPGAFSLLFRGAQVLPDWLYFRLFS
ncbi:SDR family NAD(P)-dependent oxidoreductase [Sulfitobacter aestuarii]|uniref:SDR family NAD(P)-dependent oxidoreductase n=1 Tax=Sulfitobacter aestuarii TaxID=2161676 RepID=A0ABW5U2C7_9RHOB